MEDQIRATAKAVIDAVNVGRIDISSASEEELESSLRSLLDYIRLLHGRAATQHQFLRDNEDATGTHVVLPPGPPPPSRELAAMLGMNAADETTSDEKHGRVRATASELP